jgi:hypothetical protein
VSNTTETPTTQIRTQRYYCPGCQEWHETESLLEAVRVAAERIRMEKGTITRDDENEDSRS